MLQTTLHGVIKNERPLVNLFTHEPVEAVSSDDLAEQQREALERVAGVYDSHPSPKDRIRAALALAVEHDPEQHAVVIRRSAA